MRKIKLIRQQSCIQSPWEMTKTNFTIVTSDVNGCSLGCGDYYGSLAMVYK